MKNLLFLLAIASVATLTNLRADTVVWSQDFENMTPGTVPSGPGVVVSGNNGTTQITRVVNDATTPTNPIIPPATNKSLMFEKSGGSQHVTVSFTNVPETVAGVLTLDVYSTSIAPDWNTPLFTFYTLDAASGGNIGMLISIGLTNVSVATASDGLKAAINSWTFNSINKLKIEFFTNSIYNVYVNDSLISFPTHGTNVPYYTNAFSGGIETIRVGTASTTQTKSRVFVDNIVLTIPEPSTVGLAGMAVLMLSTTLYFRHKNRH